MAKNCSALYLCFAFACAMLSQLGHCFARLWHCECQALTCGSSTVFELSANTRPLLCASSCQFFVTG
jgi:hypothetical protein